ncbi:ABC-three component system protein [Gimesia maris]|uniref:ABC-three component system protein n=1 Tax=Gimesia maris TaxID=122 RepID=UPI0012B8FD16|nr:ABC-three component system protein [Gimesia maris]
MNSTASHSAPGQAAGYFYQLERAMARLADSESGSMIAVEKEDDVSVKFANGDLQLEQDKHTLNDRSPFYDTSKALWNTLDIWTNLAELKEIDPCRCQYFLVTNVLIPDGLARSIGDAEKENIDECYKQLQEVAKKAPPTIKDIVDRVMNRDESILKSVILKIKCIDSKGNSSGGALSRKIASLLHLPDDVDEIDVLNYLFGWIANKLLDSWRDGKPGIISRSAFDKQLHRFIQQIRKHKQFGLPEHLVPFAKEELRRHWNKKYVKQVHLVTNDSTETIEAITDFVRCSSERFRLADEGVLTNDDWTEFENVLQSTWSNIFRREIRLRREEEEIIGYKILCDIRDVKADLGGDSAHRYIVMGTYHRFADDKRVGWHPRYKDLIE